MVETIDDKIEYQETTKKPMLKAPEEHLLLNNKARFGE